MPKTIKYLPKYVSNFAKYLTVTQEMAKSLLEFCLGGEISPNLVTLLLRYKKRFKDRSDYTACPKLFKCSLFFTSQINDQMEDLILSLENSFTLSGRAI